MKSIRRSLAISCVLVLALAAACAPAATPLPAATTPESPAEPPAVSAELTGAALYQLSCAACHGRDRAGSTFELAGQTIKVPGLVWDNLNRRYQSDPSRGSVPEQLALAMTQGKDAGGGELNAMMPRWSGLSQAQVDSLIEHIQTGDTTGDDPAPNLMGEQLFRTSCAACHGMDGAGKTFEKDGNTIATPSLHWSELRQTFSRDPNRGSVEEQVARAITSGQDESGAQLNSMMPRWSFLSPAQVDSLVQYLQTASK